jgi:hypothetical protein
VVATSVVLMALTVEGDLVRAQPTPEIRGGDAAAPTTAGEAPREHRSATCACDDCGDLARDEMWTRWG